MLLSDREGGAAGNVLNGLVRICLLETMSSAAAFIGDI